MQVQNEKFIVTLNSKGVFVMIKETADVFETLESLQYFIFALEQARDEKFPRRNSSKLSIFSFDPDMNDLLLISGARVVNGAYDVTISDDGMQALFEDHSTHANWVCDVDGPEAEGDYNAILNRFKEKFQKENR
jgi:hypothetical protein